MSQLTKNIPGLAQRAALKPGSVNAEKRTVDVLWGTETKVLRSSWLDGPFYEQLSMDPKNVRMERLTSGRAPLLNQHDGSVDSVLGVVQSARLENGQGVATVRFPSEGVSPEADKVFRLMQDGIISNVSVGYRIYKFEQTEGGDTETPTFRATDWEPYEISAVAMGADSSASFRSADLEPCNFISRGKPQEQRNMEETDTKTPAASSDAARQAELKAAADSAAKAERERATAIRTAARGLRLSAEIADKFVDDGSTVDAARAALIEEAAKRSESVRTEQHITVTADSKDKTIRGAEAALIQRFGMADMVAKMKARGNPKFQNVETDPGEFGGMRPVRMAQEFLERAGVNTRSMSDDAIVARALTNDMRVRAGGLAAASDFAVLLENVMYKTLLGSYTLADDTWRQFCKIDTVQDFRPSNRYRTGSFGTLPQIPESGEYTSASIPDGLKATIAAQTYGKMIAVSRQAIVNDDMGAIFDTLSKFGRTAGLTIESSVYALLATNSGLGPNMTDGNPLFDASHGNVGSSAALAVDAIDADRVLMGSQKDISANEYLNLRPKILLVPLSLGGAANILNKSIYDVSVSNKFQVPNKVAGLFTQVVDTPRLSGSRRYLFCDPSESAAIVVAFLNGEQAPTMEQQLGWRVDGTEMKVRIDFGVQAFDPKGAVTNAGV